MTRTVSIGTMVKQLAPLAGTQDVTGWESQFIVSVVRMSKDGVFTDRLSEKQIDIIERIYRSHFA